jgi:CheY-like chemotaxis protein
MMQVVSTRPRVVLAEDHAEMRERIVNLLASTFDVVAAVVDGQQAVEPSWTTWLTSASMPGTASSEGTLRCSTRTT